MEKEAVLNKIAWLCVLVLIAIAAKSLIFYPRDPATLLVESIAGHEWDYNLWRILGMADALANGMPGRWLHGFSHGWGYPLFYYTGPLPYLFGSLLVLLGFEPHSALNVCWIAAYVLTGIAMFWAMRPYLGRWGAMLAACCYLLAPYHLVDTFIRTNLVETTAFIFPPLILRALLDARVAPVKSIIIGALAVMLIPLTHMLSTYLIGFGLAVFCVTYLFLLPGRKEKIHFLSSATAMAVIGLGLSAFFWLPAIVDISAVKGFTAMTDGFYTYNKHFVYFGQLFSSYWGYGGSDPGPGDGMSFSLGLSIAAVAYMALAIGVYLVIRSFSFRASPEEKDKETAAADFNLPRFVIATGITATVMAFLTLNWSSGLWAFIPKIEVVQFPWRFLLPAVVFLAVSAGALPRLLVNRGVKLRWLEPASAVVLCLLVVTLHWDFAKVGNYASVDREKLPLATQIQSGVVTTNQLEFMPSTVRTFPYYESRRSILAKFYDENMTENKRILKESIESGIARITLTPGNAGTVILNQHWHPAWRASVDGESVETYAFMAHPFAPVAVDIPAGAYDIEFRYGYTAGGYFALSLSAILLFSALGYLLYHRRYQELLAFRIPAICIAGVLLWYGYTSVPRTISLAERVRQIEKQVPASQLTEKKRTGSAWDQDGNAIFESSGLLVRFDQLTHDNLIELSLDSNDQYQLVYLSEYEVIGQSTVPQRDYGGMSSFTSLLPDHIPVAGYDAIAVIPVQGDDRYSLGHIVTRSVESSSIEELPGVFVEPAAKVPLQHLGIRKRAGAAWDAPGHTILSERGIDAVLDNISHAARLEISLDRNDYYLIKFMRDNKMLHHTRIDPVEGENRTGIAIHRIKIPEHVMETGFDTISIVPVMGDTRYSVGHLILFD
jgi:protein-S-isoprenylcysteine O-methyltransferase Ste14